MASLENIKALYEALLAGEEPPIEPQSRVEAYLYALCSDDIANIPSSGPQSRVEAYLAAMCNNDAEYIPPSDPQSRIEKYLAALCGNKFGA